MFYAAESMLCLHITTIILENDIIVVKSRSKTPEREREKKNGQIFCIDRCPFSMFYYWWEIKKHRSDVMVMCVVVHR